MAPITHSRDAPWQGAALPARPRPASNRFISRRRSASRSISDHHGRRPSRYQRHDGADWRTRRQHPLPFAERDGARQGAVRRPCGRGRSRDQPACRRRSPRTDRGRVRSAARGDDCGSGDEARTRRISCRNCAGCSWRRGARSGDRPKDPTNRPTWRRISSSSVATSRPASRRPILSSSANSARRPSIRVISNRITRSRSTDPTVTSRSIVRPRARSMSGR